MNWRSVFVYCFLCVLLKFSLPSTAEAETRVALVLGNSNYLQVGRLKNPRNDAEDMASMLLKLGFTVLLGVDLTRSEMESRVQQFSDNLLGADMALFFYAGHGLNIDGRNYLIPVDAKLDTELDVERGLIDMELIQISMEINVETNVLLVDACRNNPLASRLARAAGRNPRKIGLVSKPSRDKTTLIGFSAQLGAVASDGVGRNSPYASALLAHLPVPKQELQISMSRVRKDVVKATNSAQIPWDQSETLAPISLTANPTHSNGKLITRGVSDKTIEKFMEYGLALMPSKFTLPNGAKIVIDQSKPELLRPELDVARDVILAARRSAFAQNCSLDDLVISNYRTLMANIIRGRAFNEQQLLYLSQLHLAAVLILLGKVVFEENDGKKIPPGVPPPCSSPERDLVGREIKAFVQARQDSDGIRR